MALELVGGALLSSSLQFLLERIGSEEILAYLRGKSKGCDFDELVGKLNIVLNSVLAVIEDAEQKQTRSKRVEAWIDMLQEAVFDAEDLSDFIETDAHQLNHKMKQSKLLKRNKLLNLFSRSRSSDDGDMEGKIKKVLERLEYIASQKNILGLEKAERKSSSWRLPSTSLVDQSGVFGRENDKSELIKLLLSDVAGGEKTCVIPIVGMGGLGKTTLAQSVYNDEIVAERFELKAWVCVSEEFDVCRVTREILEEVTSCASNVEGLNFLQVKLKESLMGKKFLIVLDDVWCEKSADLSVMCMPFKGGVRGSKIIVTTRSENVASVMSTGQIYRLQKLSDEACWKLFVEEASGSSEDFTEDQYLKGIGEEIVKKCKGLPLALKTLGSLLRAQGVGEWERILESDIWDLREDESNIFAALKLSYHYLPSQLKRCFAYCSIFPKDYEFKKEQLILLWMAQNLLEQPNKNRRFEDVGDEYFRGLVSRSFFQFSSTNKSAFVMHDLIHDLAKSVSVEFCSHLEAEKIGEINVKKLRHFAYIATRGDSYGKFRNILQATKLRTFLPIEFDSWKRRVPVRLIDDLVLKLRCLRALSLSGYENVNFLPDFIGELFHLRYLDLSHTGIIKLPETLCNLFNLQTLKLTNCRNLERLPEDFHLLIKLRFLDIHFCRKLAEMPKNLSKLKSLQNLSTFIVGKHNGTEIGELRELNLRGKLCVKKLENVGNGEAMQDQAVLINKKHLETLILEWSEENNSHPKQAQDVLDLLSPHRNLKSLQIYDYPGKEFPNWLGSNLFGNLDSVTLANCRNCSSLPPLGQLSSLKNLQISGFDALVILGPEFYGTDHGAKSFPSLEILRFINMSSWMSWSNEGCSSTWEKLRELEITYCPKLTGDFPTSFPSLTKLKIFSCEKLESLLPILPSVLELDLTGCENMMQSFAEESRQLKSCQIISLASCSSRILVSVGCLPTNLKILNIRSCFALEFEFNWPHKAIEVLDINQSCNTLTTLPVNYFPNLKKLYIRDMDGIESLDVSNELYKDMTSLSSLHIVRCRSFRSFSKDGLCALNLTYLAIHDCNILKYFPEKMHDRIPSLKCMEIIRCPGIELSPGSSLPDSLCSVSISDCYKLTATQNNKHWKSLPNLRHFRLADTNSATESFPEESLLPVTITSLHILYFPCLKSLNQNELRKLSFLEHISFFCLPKLRSIPGQVLPNSLKSLHIVKCDELQTISEGLPNSLENISVKNCPMLRNISPKEFPSTLKELRISNCPELQTMPEKALSTSLSNLSIDGCPLLAKKCLREKGEYWNKIAHIYCIEIDEEIIS